MNRLGNAQRKSIHHSIYWFELLPQPYRNFYQSDQYWHFNQRSNYSSEGLSGVQSENSNRNCDGQFEIIPCRGKRNGSGFVVGSSHGFGKEKADEEQIGRAQV